MFGCAERIRKIMQPTNKSLEGMSFSEIAQLRDMLEKSKKEENEKEILARRPTFKPPSNDWLNKQDPVIIGGVQKKKEVKKEEEKIFVFIFTSDLACEMIECKTFLEAKEWLQEEKGVIYYRGRLVNEKGYILLWKDVSDIISFFRLPVSGSQVGEGKEATKKLVMFDDGSLIEMEGQTRSILLEGGYENKTPKAVYDGVQWVSRDDMLKLLPILPANAPKLSRNQPVMKKNKPGNNGPWMTVKQDRACFSKG